MTAMDVFMRVVLGWLLLLCASCLSAADTLTLNIDPTHSQFVVALPSNPTTGYQWTVTSYDKTILQMTSSHYVAPQTKRIGAGGQMIFTFAPVKGKAYPQSTKMSFTYARPWQPKRGTLKEVTVNFTKKP